MFSRFFQSRIFMVMALVIIFFLAVSVAKLWPQKTVIEARLQNLEGKIGETEKSNLEREAKLKLNVRRPDENVVFIYEDGNEGEIKNKEGKGEEFNFEDLTNFGKWIKYLKSLF